MSSLPTFSRAKQATDLRTKRKIFMVSSTIKFTLVLADNLTYSFVAHTARAAVDFTRHVWVFGWR